MIILISFSGGNTSRFMAEYIMANPKYSQYEKIVVFANSSKERAETLDFVNECDKYYKWNVVWVEADFSKEKNSTLVTDYYKAKRKGEVFEAMIQKYGIPNISFPHCSRELKQRAIDRYMRNLGLKRPDYLTAIGIRADEPDRLTPKPYTIYPLATDIQVTERFIIEWSQRQPITLNLKSYQGNCDLCYKKSKRKKMTIIAENPEIPLWWAKMEEKYSEGKYFFHRGNQSTSSLIAEAKESKYEKAKDAAEIINATPELDFEKPCFCKA